jgi:virginiamycin B lyase
VTAGCRSSRAAAPALAATLGIALAAAACQQPGLTVLQLDINGTCLPPLGRADLTVTRACGSVCGPGDNMSAASYDLGDKALPLQLLAEFPPGFSSAVTVALELYGQGRASSQPVATASRQATIIAGQTTTLTLGLAPIRGCAADGGIDMPTGGPSDLGPEADRPEAMPDQPAPVDLPPPPPDRAPPPSCQSDAGCGPGQICQGTACVPGDCTPSGDTAQGSCAAGQACCHDPARNGNFCSSGDCCGDSDCSGVERIPGLACNTSIHTCYCATEPCIREFSIGDGSAAVGPLELAVGPDQAMWFTGGSSHSINRITLDGQYSRVVDIPGGGQPEKILTGPDGHIWFTDAAHYTVSRLDGDLGQLSLTVTEFALPASEPNSAPFGMAVGPDGNLWYASAAYSTFTGFMGVLQTDGTFLPHHPVPCGTGASCRQPYWVIATSSSIFFTVNPGAQIAQMSLDGTYNGVSVGAGSNLQGLIADAQGAIWFAEASTNKIGRLDPATDQVVEYRVPTMMTSPVDLAVAPDGDVWFTESFTNRLGRVRVAQGEVTEYAVPTSSALLGGLLMGPDGTLWFTEYNTDKIGVFRPTAMP